MGDIIEFQLDIQLVEIEMTCGHVIFVTQRFQECRVNDHKPFWCSACGNPNEYTAPKIATPVKKTIGQKVVSLFRTGEEA